MPIKLLLRLPSITSVADRTICRRSLDDASTPMFSATGIGDDGAIAVSVSGVPTTATGTVGTDLSSPPDLSRSSPVGTDLSSPPGDTIGVDTSFAVSLGVETFEDLERFLTDF